MSSKEQTFVIVGAGLAGAEAADTLREESFDGRVVLIGAEPEPPYERPPLSKEYLRGEAGREKVWVNEDDSHYENAQIELRTNTQVSAVHASAREIELTDGELIAFDKLLLATGAEPRRLQIVGADLDGIHYLRSIADSDRLGERIQRGGHLVVVGAGWIGTEVAASARGMGCEVTLIEGARSLSKASSAPSWGRSTGTFTPTTASSSSAGMELSASKAPGAWSAWC